jgi:hypothetical protein
MAHMARIVKEEAARGFEVSGVYRKVYDILWMALSLAVKSL